MAVYVRRTVIDYYKTGVQIGHRNEKNNNPCSHRPSGTTLDPSHTSPVVEEPCTTYGHLSLGLVCSHGSPTLSHPLSAHRNPDPNRFTTHDLPWHRTNPFCIYQVNYTRTQLHTHTSFFLFIHEFLVASVSVGNRVVGRDCDGRTGAVVGRHVRSRASDG